MKSFVSHWGPSRRVASSLLMAMAAVAAHAQQGGGQWELERSESSALGGGGGNPCYQHSYSGGPGGAVHTQRLVCGNQPWSGTATGNWSAPPSRLVPGERIQMNLSGSATASHSGINIGLNLSASFNAAGCGGSRNAVEIARLTVASNQPNTSRQVSGSAVVPGSGWSSDVPDLQGRLRLTVCMDGWGASYWYRWLPASTSSGGSRQETGPGRGHTDVVGPPESGSGPGTGPGAGGMLPITYSPWMSITPDQRQYVTQPGRAFPVPVVGAQHLTAGDYMVYTAVSEPNGRRISRWATHGPLTLRSGDKILAILNFNIPGSELQIERNSAALLPYSTPERGTAMVYARNMDASQWRSICLLPVGAAMSVRTHCFRHDGPIEYVPDGTSGNSTDIPSHAQDTQPVRVFFNGNDGRVFNGPTRPTQVRFDRPVQINRITTYHWNNGQGTPVPGTIALMTSDGRWIGPWQAAGESGQGGAPNAYWSVTPNLVLPAGTYTIIDSDPSTWSHNSGSDGAGHAWIDGMRR